MVEDLEALLGEFTVDSDFAKDFFERFVRGRELPDFRGLLEHAGVKLFGLDFDSSMLDYSQFRVTQAGVEVLVPTIVGTPLYNAGLEQGTLITAFNGQLINTEKDLKRLIQYFKPGAKIELEFLQRGVAGRGTLTTTGLTKLHLSTFEDAWTKPTDEMLRFRADWLGSRAGN